MSDSGKSPHRREPLTFPELESHPDLDPEDVLEASRFLTGKDPTHTAVSRIRGIDYIRTLRAWIAVENQIGPREEIITELVERKRVLDTFGERPERALGPRKPARPKRVVFRDENGEPYERQTSDVTGHTQRKALSTDGGQDNGA